MPEFPPASSLAAAGGGARRLEQPELKGEGKLVPEDGELTKSTEVWSGRSGDDGADGGERNRPEAGREEHGVEAVEFSHPGSINSTRRCRRGWR